ncbi:aminotransferase class I/II-fold pyridoxal phosphate-dependent enzyme [Alteribacillus iranensis]|uniref:Arginine/lysine/ornithine decarboxylase n=1 Tax=Alteribacillus iranensis TaxID=930128 RepID=A0A1I2BJB6_9BACI|nr:aminotransferase class I/II-fold pyridoxal phosphate-dependent enzyme [Alteribacillus iranensis]SFE56282.1 Arginine/lysine/ornithine decarboxylase [Alteribacillus iranensis]
MWNMSALTINEQPIHEDTQKQAPLYDALRSYEQSNRTSLHVPGHKDGRVFDPIGTAHFSEVMKIDTTHSKGIDDLHHPQDFIAEAQRLAAETFRADHTYFLVGGSTVGNMSTALTLCRPGDKILVQRNMHKSVFHGLMIAGARPIFIAPSMEATTKVAKMSDISFIKQALEDHPDAKGVWITNPNYYGMHQDMTSLARFCHEREIPLIVDEAHGAHFGLIDEVPPSALSQGADLVVQSTHKMLPAMTMASMLHVQSTFIDRERLSQVLGMVQSTSPSYPLLASLDLARRYIATQGAVQLKDTVKRLEKERRVLSCQLQKLSIWSGSEGVDHMDPLKWIISCEGVTGYQLLDMFYEEGCTAEISDPRNICFLFSLSESEEDIKKVVTAINTIDKKLQNMSQWAEVSSLDMELFAEEGTIHQPEMPMSEAFHSKRKQVPLKHAVGEICAETVLPYPPGIPLLTPGEKIITKHVKAINKLKETGAYFQSPSDDSMETLYVVSR